MICAYEIFKNLNIKSLVVREVHPHGTSASALTSANCSYFSVDEIMATGKRLCGAVHLLTWQNEAKYIKAPTHRPDVQLPYPTTLRPLSCLLSDPLGRKVPMNTLLRRAASSTVACTFCACVRCNKRVALDLKTLDERFMHATLFTFDQK